MIKSVYSFSVHKMEPFFRGSLLAIRVPFSTDHQILFSGTTQPFRFFPLNADFNFGSWAIALMEIRRAKAQSILFFILVGYFCILLSWAVQRVAADPDTPMIPCSMCRYRLLRSSIYR